MSVGFYLVSAKEIPEMFSNQAAEFLSKKDLYSLGYSKKEIKEISSYAPFVVSSLNSNEKLFALDFNPDNEPSIEIIRDMTPETISQYAIGKYYYEIKVNKWDGFYESLAQYLKEISEPYELWEIWEGTIDKKI